MRPELSPQKTLMDLYLVEEEQEGSHSRMRGWALYMENEGTVRTALCVQRTRKRLANTES